VEPEEFYDTGSRDLQRRFGTEALATHLSRRYVLDRLEDEHVEWIRGADTVYVATVDSRGNPECSYKGGLPGFVRVLDDRTLEIPSYDGNGMYRTLGNIATERRIGLLFLLPDVPAKLRVNGACEVLTGDGAVGAHVGAEAVVRVAIREVFENCPRYLHDPVTGEPSAHCPRPEYEPPAPDWKLKPEYDSLLPHPPDSRGVTVQEPQDEPRRRLAPAPRVARDGHIVELSHPVEHGMLTYPGLPGPRISDHLSREQSHERYPAGTEFQIGAIAMVANTGTYMDTPFHRYRDGADLASIDLSRLVDVAGAVVDVTGSGDRGVGPDALAGLDVTGRAVLIRTGWDRHWGTSFYGDASHPFLTADAVAWLVERSPALVGIDSVNIDDMADMTRPAHTGLLAAQIPIVEHLCGLERLPGSGFRFHAAPVPVVGMGSFPVCAYAVL
jgi:kynurenine formamidase/predicted pyridoxine 5'-phosphate oxidase superfamily flavin-nucleotide-binding protein